MAAYEHGIYDLDDSITATGANNLGNFDAGFWSSSTLSNVTANAWYVNLAYGVTLNTSKSSSLSVLCVAP